MGHIVGSYHLKRRAVSVDLEVLKTMVSELRAKRKQVRIRRAIQEQVATKMGR